MWELRVSNGSFGAGSDRLNDYKVSERRETQAMRSIPALSIRLAS
jgi:hypothetical protein